MTQTAELTASDGTQDDQFAPSVSISGNIVVAGSPNATIRQGAQGSAYLFVEPPTGWADNTETAKLVASDPQSSAQWVSLPQSMATL
jgi:FG-GAP repeat